jgi:cytochrome c peroxidase
MGAAQATRKGRSLASAAVVSFLLAAGCARSEADLAKPVVIPLRAEPRPAEVVRRDRARGIPPLKAPVSDDRRVAQAAVGRRVFFDGSFGGGALACTRCHDPSRSGAGAPVSFGAEGRLDVPALVDLVAYARFGTSGAARALDDYVALHVAALGGDPGAREAAIEAAYGAPLRAVFPAAEGATPPPPSKLAALALAAYLEGLVAPSRVDAFLAGDASALTAQEIAGFDALFARGCVACHDGAAFGGRKVATLGLAVPWPGDAPLGEHAEWKPRRSRRVASLRHAAYAAPYFHEGAVEDLPTAVGLMAAHQLGVLLPDDERDAIVAFLRALAGPQPPALRAPEPPPAP